MRVTPNPAHTSTVLRFALPTSQNVTLAVYDLAGRRVASVLDAAPTSAGQHQVPLGTQGWHPGVYLCRLEVGSRALTGKMVVIR